VRTTLHVLTIAAALAGCKSDSKPTVATGGGGGGTGGVPVAPAHAGKPFDRATFEEISKLDFNGATTTVLELTDDSLALKVMPMGEPATAATIRLSRCLNCVAMDRAQWEARVPELRQLLPKELRDLPETVFELGDVSISGEKTIYVHQVGVYAIGGTGGQTLQRAMNTHAYTVYWNDGVNQAQIVAKDASLPDSATVEVLAAKVPRDTLGKLAGDAFTTILPLIRGK